MVLTKTIIVFGLCLAMGGATAHSAAGQVAATEQTFLRGLAALDLGRFAEAREHFTALRGRHPILEDYRLYYLGEAALGAGDVPAAAEYFRALIAEHPQSRWYWVAREKKAAAAMAVGQWDAAAAELAAIGRETRDPDVHRRARLQIAALAVRRGDAVTAWSLYRHFYTDVDSAAELADVKDGLRLYGERFHRDPVAQLPVEERVDLARTFLRRHLATEAADLLHGAVAGRKGAPIEWQELLGQAHFQARRYAEAATVLCRLADDGGFAMDRTALLRLCATASARAGDTTTAIARNRKIIDELPGSASAAVALFKTAFLRMEGGDYAAAAKTYREWLATKPRAGGTHSEALWVIAWCHYRLRQWDAALAALDELEGAIGSHRAWLGRITYWRARIREAQGKPPMARALYEAVVAIGPGTYYGTLASHRLRGGAQAALFQLAAAGAGNRQPEGAMPLQSPKARELARLDLWHLALEAEEFAYPKGTAYRIGIERLGRKWDVPPALVAGLIRQESQFRATAVSPAGAIGLMQIIPETARQLARELHWWDFHDRDLYRPVANVRLGIWYLRKLRQQFDGWLPLMLAGYNAGEEAVERWVKGYWAHRAPTGSAPDMTEFIEEIPYDETINYVKQVLRNYWSS